MLIANYDITYQALDQPLLNRFVSGFSLVFKLNNGLLKLADMAIAMITKFAKKYKTWITQL